jgi:septation ring formation regulator EzrA
MTQINLNVDAEHLAQNLKELSREVDYWGSELARALKDQLTAEHTLTVAKAKKQIAIRKSPESYGFAKVTEELVKALVEADAEIITLSKQLTDAEIDVKSLKAMMDTLDTKRMSIKYTSELVLGGKIEMTPFIPGVSN